MARPFKRQFQPSISSYVDRISSESNNLVHEDVGEPAPSMRLPTLPATIQSSLLNVGMRVRKSVPEGYQTKAKMTSSSYGSTSYHGGPSSKAYEHNLPPAADPIPSYRGLVPYCGILKIGGYAAQSVPAEEDLPPLQFDDDSPLPSSSQTSNTSSITDTSSIIDTNMIPATVAVAENNKRRREDADDEDLGLESQPVSPRSHPISHTRMPNLDQLRSIALPKPRRKVSMAEDHGGGMRESEMIDVGDFGEAPFFRPEEWGSIGIE